jgi:serine/threonine protein kinase
MLPLFPHSPNPYLFLLLASLLVDLDFEDKLALPREEQMVMNRRYFMAPELVKQEPWGCKIDIWSLGCVIFQMLETNPHKDLSLFKSNFLTINNGPR